MSLLGKLFFLGWILLPISMWADDFEARVYTDSDGKSLPYRLHIPVGYDSAKTYPLVLFFHGAGERGTDNLNQLKHGVKSLTSPDAQAKYPAFVIAPQCPVGKQWVDMPWGALSGVRPDQPSESMQLALKILDAVTAEFSIDKDRIYVAGLSMGGYAAWDCVTRFPDRFAAAVAVCGGGDENTVTPDVAKVPVWAFGSSDDHTVPPIRSLHMVEAMMEKGGKPRYYLYTGLGHFSWDKAFSEPELLPWLFSQHRSTAAPNSPDDSPPVEKGSTN